jgi:selenocysteine lyase/cysteine desulfurase
LEQWTRLRAEPWRIRLEDEMGALSKGRALCARLIGAEPDEIAMMVNTSYGINFAARALPMSPGDVVVSSEREFPANVYPWMALEQSRGVKLHLVPVRDRLADEEGLLAALDMPRVRVLTVSWVSFETGKRLDLERLGRACRERGIFFVVDAIQGVGAAPLDAHACFIDVLACGAQKWMLGPWGSGFAYVRRDLVPSLTPNDTGWLSLKASQDFGGLCSYSMEWVDGASRFEVCTLPYPDFGAMNASLEMFFEVGLPEVQRLVAERAAQIVEWAEKCPDVRLVTPRDPASRAGIVTVIPRDPVATADRLARAGVYCSLREGAIRLSPHFYTTAEEVDRALREF